MKLCRQWVTLLCMFVAYQEGTARNIINRDRHQSAPQKADSRTPLKNVDWMERGQQDLMTSLKVWPKWKAAKNVILFIGDGMGFSTHTAARFYKAQKTKKQISETSLSWEQFTSSGTIKTYSADRMSPESGSTATAILCGEKTRSDVIGCNQNVPRANCSMVKGNELKSMLHHAIDEGKWTGIVSTARITHATPSAAYAHTSLKDWESDADIPEGADDTCIDIAWQLIHGPQNKEIRVILGGGRGNFMLNNATDPEYPEQYGNRRDGVDLIKDWISIQKEKGLTEAQYKYVENQTDFDSADVSEIQYMLGLFEPSHMQHDDDRPSDTWGEPSLAEMVSKSIDILQKEPNGYFLYVEGARIDHAHHDSNAHRALENTLGLEDAVQVAIDKTSEDDTLIVLTSDHSHVFTLGGDAAVDTDVFGIVVTEKGELQLGDDGKPFLILNYANGPGYYRHKPTDECVQNDTARINLTSITTDGTDFLQDAAVPRYSETHAGEDVGIYARGPMSHLFAGLHEQSYIAHVVGYAACLGWNKEMCSENPPVSPGCEQDVSSSDFLGTFSHLSYLLILAITILLY